MSNQGIGVEVRELMRGQYDYYEDGTWKNYKKTVLALLQQCKDAGLTVSQALFVLEQAKQDVIKIANRAPVEF